MSDDDDLSKPPTKRDSLEVLLQQAVAAPPVLVEGTIVADRYVIERELGAGGMGTVYLARDRDLSRSVAIKVHRFAATSERLHREAVAMARLAHPNVVAVFEIGELGTSTFVAMEYIEGETLRAWLHAHRTSAQILDALVAAGTGLAAAHAAELVHRDIKPDNIFVGRDGRVRIGDFGLAQIAIEASEPVSASIGSATATGTVIGTPAYMAPEQIDGGVVDARSDQFAFCVTAWEALSGTRPFAGDDTGALRVAIARGVIVPPKRRVAARIRRILLRGLSVDPARRWPSIEALLAALRSAQRRPRIIAGIAGVVACAAAVAIWQLRPGQDPAAFCDDIEGGLYAAVPTFNSAALVAAVRDSGTSHAADRSRLLGNAIANQRARDTKVARVACRATARHQWSPSLQAAARECRIERAASTREILVAAPPVGSGVSDLLLLAQRLPDVEMCADASQLAGWRSLDAGTVAFDDVVIARSRIDRAMAQTEVGRTNAAWTTLGELARAPAAASPAVHGRLELLRGMLEVATGAYAPAVHRFSDAYFAARAADDSELALDLVAHLIQVTGNLLRDPIASERWVSDGLADAERDHLRHPENAGFVFMAIAAVYIDQGRGDDAVRLAQRAADVVGDVFPILELRTDPVMTAALSEAGRPQDALAANDRWIKKLGEILGEHPSLAGALADRATILLDLGRESEAAVVAQQAKSILDTEATSDSASLAALEITFGATLLGIDDPAGAVYLARARATLVAQFGEDHPDIALIDSNLALVYLDAGDLDRALTALRHAVAIDEKILGPDHLDLASALYNLAVAERQAKHYDAARDTARRSAAIYDKRQHGSARHVDALAHIAMIENLANRPTDALAVADSALVLPMNADSPQSHAWAALEAARSLIALGRDSKRARQLLDDARTGFSAANLPARVDEVDALRSTL